MNVLSGCRAPIVDRRCTECRRPALLDAYCCQGGAAAGYATAGFCVTGVDLFPQPRFPFGFHQADAVEFIGEHGHLFAACHASPPCQRYTLCQRIQGREHPDLIAPTREALIASGRPWLIENVEDARPELRDPILLCGAMFPGLRSYRHRLIETSFPVAPLLHPDHEALTVKMGRRLEDGDWFHAVGNFSNVAYVRDNLRVPWMSRDGIRECVPPLYGEWLGGELAKALKCQAVAA